LGCDALTLARARGAAWVGKPLDMVIPVQLDAGEDATALCFEADVFHADTRQEASRVRVLVETTEQAQSINVRVRSSALVDEPVVTVYLRTGCGQKTSRRYVLLADVPSDTATPLAVARPPIARAVPSPVTALAPEHADAVPPETPPTAQARKVRVPKPPVTKVAPVKSSAVPDKKLPERASGQSRLKLDPLDLLSDRVANLDAYMTFEPPEDALRNRQRMQALEDALKTSQLQAVKTEASLADLKHRLQQAESERFPVVVLYGLLALVLASRRRWRSSGTVSAASRSAMRTGGTPRRLPSLLLIWSRNPCRLRHRSPRCWCLPWRRKWRRRRLNRFCRRLGPCPGTTSMSI
jgi:hypothetical protein